MKICFFGSSLVSSFWNGAATYYRGILKQLAALGHDITFFEPDAFGRQQHRDIADPDWARVVVYPATDEGWQKSLESAARSADVLVKASNVGVHDAELEAAITALATSAVRIFWDVDAPATLDAIADAPAHHLRVAVPKFDMVLTYGGGDPVVAGYTALGAKSCVPIYNALDPDTHFPMRQAGPPGFDLSFLGNRMPDREARVEAFFIEVARLRPKARLLLGGAGWETKTLPDNIRLLGHVDTGSHNAFFGRARATLNINRESMARYGFSPPTRVFEAVGAGACLITDRWEGIELFLKPETEVLVASGADEVAALLDGLTEVRAQNIARQARRRVLADHTYKRRAAEVDRLLIHYVQSEAAE